MPDKQMPTPTPDQILAALRQAGWLLEQDAQTALTSAGYYVTPGASFPDPDDDSVSREIDVMGWKTVGIDEASRRHVGIRILAECKQSAMPYVLVGRTSSERDRTAVRREQTFAVPSVTVARVQQTGGGTTLRRVPAHRYLGLEAVPPWNDEFVASQMTRLDLKSGTWSAGNDGIFTSLMYPLAKASAHFHSQTKHITGAVEFRFPVVVTSAPVYRLNVDDPTMTPVEVPWATMARSIASASLKGTFRVDVVTYSALDRYLTERVGSLEAVLRAVPLERFFTEEDMEWEASAAE